jgi:hypothetical protein
MKQTQITCEIAKMWHDLSEDEKRPYKLRSIALKEAYDKEKAQWDLLHPSVRAQR